VSGGQQLLHSRFFDSKRYDLGRVGRYKINKKAALTIPDAVRTHLRRCARPRIDYLIKSGTRWLAAASLNEQSTTLGNRPCALVGELLQKPGRVGLNRLERIKSGAVTVGETESLNTRPAGQPKPLGGRRSRSSCGSSQLSIHGSEPTPWRNSPTSGGSAPRAQAAVTP